MPKMKTKSSVKKRFKVTATGKLRNKNLPFVTHCFRIHMLITLGKSGNSGSMQSCFMSKGGRAHIRSIRVRAQVSYLADRARHPGQLFEALIGQAFKTKFELERWCQTDKVGVAASLTIAVYSSLNLFGSGGYCSKSVGDGQFGIVVGMDSHFTGKLGIDSPHHFFYESGHAASIGVAKHNPIATSLEGGLKTLHGILWI